MFDIEIIQPFAEGQDAVECAFYLNLDPMHQIDFRGAKATAFPLDESVHIRSNGLHLQLDIKVIEGEGRFFGHIARANRPGQKGKNLKFEVFDWQIGVRTICRLQTTLTIKT